MLLNTGMDYWEEQLLHHFLKSSDSAWMLFYKKRFNQTPWGSVQGLTMCNVVTYDTRILGYARTDHPTCLFLTLNSMN